MLDHEVLRGLVCSYLEVCAHPDQQRRRDEWRKHNSLQPARTLIYVRAFAFSEMAESHCLCQDPLLRQYESQLRYNLFWDSLKDDSIFEPWLTVGAVHRCAGWGLDIPRQHTDQVGGAFKVDYPLKSLADTAKLRIPRHDIDEVATSQRLTRLQDAVGDLITINLDRGPAYRRPEKVTSHISALTTWTGGIDTAAGGPPGRRGCPDAPAHPKRIPCSAIRCII